MMTPIDLAILTLLAIVVAVVPPMLLRRNPLRWAMAEAAFWAVVAVIAAGLNLFAVELPGSLLFSMAFVGRVAFFVGFILLTDEESIEWNPARAAIATGVVYLLLVPHVLQWPIDGDEPYFVLIAESIITDFDLDLANQYESLADSETGRLDLTPQFGDPTGGDGEIYSRHEPFFAALLIPGLLLAGLHGAVATVALLSVLMTWSVLKLVEESGFPDVARTIVWPAIALAPPVLFYSIRLWAEVPGALALSESIRAMQAKNWKRFVAWLVILSLLQLRFGLIAIGLLLLLALKERIRARTVITALAALALPFAVIWLATGRVFGVHHLAELMPVNPLLYARGFAGLLVDAQAGMLFQAPLWLLGIAALLRRYDRLRVGGLWLAALPYLILLLPRAEWHGGWSPPLRYVVVLTPVVALSLGAALRWLPRSVNLLAAFWTAGIVIHGIAFPWRLFQIASGESVLGKALSRLHEADASRFLPSLIRFNQAAILWLVVLVVVLILITRFRGAIGARVVAVAASLVLAGFSVGLRVPGDRVELEDAHVTRIGGELYPERWTVARFRFRGGWSMAAGSVASFRMAPGTARLDYASAEGAVIEIDGRRWDLPPTEGFESATVEIADPDVDLLLLSGSAIIDRIVHE